MAEIWLMIKISPLTKQHGYPVTMNHTRGSSQRCAHPAILGPHPQGSIQVHKTKSSCIHDCICIRTESNSDNVQNTLYPKDRL